MRCEDLTIKTAVERIGVFSNKKTGCYFSQSKNGNRDYWRGWFIGDDKILDDYALLSENGFIEKSEIISEIFPHKIKKIYKEIIIEEILADFTDSLILKFENQNENIAFVPMIAGERRITGQSKINFGTIMLELDNKKFLRVSAANGNGLEFTGKFFAGLSENKYLTPLKIPLPKGNGVIVFSCSDSANKAESECFEVLKNYDKLIAAKQKRLDDLLCSTNITVSDKDYEKSLKWVLIQADNLIMEKAGKGIYAGYPWFNNYWGRDTFISFPGATLASGKFKDAKEILLSFFNFQNQYEDSEFYGRVPNRVNNEKDIIYNTADGTPWSVIQLYNYVKYSGDTDLLKSLFLNVKLSIVANIKNTDEYYFLKHKDAETWMDAQINGKVPITPRGDRANDIQALWYNQLKSGIKIAEILGERNEIENWRFILTKLKENFKKIFVNKSGTLFDHINSDGTPDFQIRPNQIFAVSLGLYDLIDFETGEKICNEVFEKLTVPYGVMSLNKEDKNFKPVHHSPNYHFDFAYHNGTVWQWLAGHLITSLLKFNKINEAFQLTQSMIEQSLKMGAAGCIAELIDAMPDKNGAINLSGAFSQAWSNAEFIRNFYSDYCGFNPDLLNNIIYLKPKFPEKINFISFAGFFGDSIINIFIEKKSGKYFIKLEPVKIKQQQKINLVLNDSPAIEVDLGKSKDFIINSN